MLGTATAPRTGVARAGMRRAAEVLSTAIVALMVVASAIGLLVHGLYPDEAWGREALRGGDLVTLLLVAPVLWWSLRATRRGSLRGQAVWIGALAYGVYDYAYYVFGARFNDIFLLHVALLAMSIWAAALAVASTDVGAVASAFLPAPAARRVGGFLSVVGTILGGLWVVLAIRQAITGRLMADVPVEGVHLVFGIDLALLVPALVVSGVLLWRRTDPGLVFGTAMAVMGALYQANLLASGAFQAAADVAGAKAFPPDGVVLAVGFAVAAAAMLLAGAHETDRGPDQPFAAET
jgi:hypothetical protein